jgi:hypothetical protein
MNTSSTTRMPDWLSQALAKDPAFRVLTMDGVGWIDPYSGAVVAAPFGHGEVAARWLLEKRPWNKAKPKPLKELLYLRWLHYLRAHLEFVEHLRIFKHGMWLNPYTGEWVAGITLVNNEITLATIEDLARELGACHEAQSGKMLEKYRLEILIGNGPDQRLIDAAKASAGPAAAGPAKSARPTRNRTDFHHVKSQFLKTLSRPPRVEGYQIVMHYEPHSPIPRNFYDFISLDRNRLLVVIGDFAGEGPGAALMVASAMRSMRRLAALKGDLVELIAGLNDELRVDLFPGCTIALFAAVLDIPTNALTCLSVGFPPVALINPQRAIALQRIHTGGQAFGISHGAPFRASLKPLSIQLEAGDMVVMTTDGVAKGRNPGNVAAGRPAVMGSCLAHAALPFAQLLGRVVEEAKQGYGGTFTDDLAAVGLRVKGADEPQTGRYVQIEAPPPVPVAKPATRRRV